MKEAMLALILLAILVVGVVSMGILAQQDNQNWIAQCILDNPTLPQVETICGIKGGFNR